MLATHQMGPRITWVYRIGIMLFSTLNLYKNGFDFHKIKILTCHAFVKT